MFKKDNLKIEIYKTRKEMGKNAARDTADCIKMLLGKKEYVRMIFAAAPSQNEFLEALAADKSIEWSRIEAFHMDEYVGLPSDAPQGFGNFLNRAIFSKVPFKNVNYINETGKNEIEAACKEYSEKISSAPVDIVCMGVGENGHIAFNDPDVADFNDSTVIKKVKLDEICRNQQVNDGCFKTINDVPEYALTLTIPTLFNCENIFCVVPSKTKAQAVYNMLHWDIDEKCPATILRKHTNAKLYLDENSSIMLNKR